MLPGDDDGGEDLHVSIPRGGPIYVPNMVSPITKVPVFETSVSLELQSLEEELADDTLEECEEIMVDELKIISEDELVNMAFEEAFKGGELTVYTSQDTDENSSLRITDDNGVSSLEHACPQRLEADMLAVVPVESSVVPRRDSDCIKSNEKPTGKIKKRRRGDNSNSLDESCIAKVEQLARIKQKQEEDKASVRLHSFNGSSKAPDCGTLTKKVEMIRSLKSASVSAKVRPSDTCGNKPVDFPEVVLCLEVYHNKRTTLKTQEFLVLGRQLLTDVKDKIYCLTDEIMDKAGRYNPSGYFFIEDVFYNDMRGPSAIDYSMPILDWLQNSKNEALDKWESIFSGELQQKQKALLGDENKRRLPLPQLRACHMQNIRFFDLMFQIGAGYLYCHQGDCKHVFVIRDMRLIHSEDVQNQAAYPLMTFQTKYRCRKCSVCKIYQAQKVTVDDKWAPLNPCYFCDVCYYMLHYENGTLLYTDFSVYDYYHE
ncbi:snRNA-activating protein complex subunit-like [Primulina eburnea]|uniref:snRNA-activating protein complex subunit-like n=1 Tax=Primulina eburnea TaxID=1245227 RepID=UPI003C6C149E